MLSNYYPTTPDEGNETSPQSSCSTQPYWDNVEYAPWMNADVHPSILENGSDMQFNSTWDQSIPTAVPDQGWAYDYGSMSTGNIQTSRDQSPNVDYFGAADSISMGTSYPKAVWDPNEQPLYSPYSEVPPMLGTNPPGLTTNSMTPHPYPLALSQFPPSPPPLTTPPTTTSTSTKTSSSSSKPTPKPSKSKPTPTPTPKQPKQPKDTSKHKPTKSSSSSSSKRKSPPTSQNNLTLPQEVHRIASEHLSREAWRVCDVMAVEMTQRRAKLLQHDSGKLGRDMVLMRHNLGLIREGAEGNQGVLEDVLRRAERLG